LENWACGVFRVSASGDCQRARFVQSLFCLPGFRGGPVCGSRIGVCGSRSWVCGSRIRSRALGSAARALGRSLQVRLQCSVAPCSFFPQHSRQGKHLGSPIHAQPPHPDPRNTISAHSHARRTPRHSKLALRISVLSIMLFAHLGVELCRDARLGRWVSVH